MVGWNVNWPLYAHLTIGFTPIQLQLGRRDCSLPNLPPATTGAPHKNSDEGRIE